MAYEWQLIRENLAPPSGSEQWSLITLSASPEPLAYGFRLTFNAAPPSRWNTAGYFGLIQFLGGRACMTRTHPIPLFVVSGESVIRHIGSGDIDLIGPGSEIIAVVYMVHSWVDADKMQIWGYYSV